MAIRDQDFEFISRLLMKHAGIVLVAGKEYLVESRLQPVVRDAEVGSIAELVEGIESGNTSLRDRVVDSLTTNETSFFRDSRVYDLLREDVLPELIETKRNDRKLNIWCGASSSGQEPLSMLILLHESFPEVFTWEFNYIATDISDEMLERCNSGVYSQLEVSRGLPTQLLVKYFDKRGAKWVAKPTLRDRVEYRKMNLIEAFPPMPKMDLVMMRNVLIYFDDERKKQILDATRSVMHAHGILLLGGGETTRGDSYRRITASSSCYYRAS